ncbi:1-acyl-sn-glycerol-3-phosphate acyltransferase [Actinomyces radicidentis]|uniref:1-acyl-sn-glycerol-3-phosphate acyltransferase n=1 Tax=Actinomyces radicidentis TaxID=111015 RepID=UPI0026DF0E13|nr:1-acyl-sn-glycerol-3-phosphate acyltransferase [Actinomyces radicidentis]
MSLKHAVARAFLAVSPWRVVTQEMPERVVLIGAPHTSYFDGVLMAVSLWSADRDFRFLVKDSAAHAPVIGGLIRRIGGIPVERSASHGLVEQMIERFADGAPFTLCLTPKGTRGRREYWKSGFYRIATAADVPIQLGFIDRCDRTFGWGPTYRLTGDVRADMDVIRAFYDGKQGVRPALSSVPRLRAEDEEAEPMTGGAVPAS